MREEKERGIEGERRREREREGERERFSLFFSDNILLKRIFAIFVFNAY